MRTGSDRLRHAIGFELIGLMLCPLIASWVMGMQLLELGKLAIMLSVIATAWNYVYNLLVDKLMQKLLGRTQKSLPERVLHTLMFEAGLLLFVLPLIAWLLQISLKQAFVLDMGFVIFYLVYAFFYNWAYDRMFPIPAAATATITVDEPVTREKASIL